MYRYIYDIGDEIRCIMHYNRVIYTPSLVREDNNNNITIR